MVLVPLHNLLYKLLRIEFSINHLGEKGVFLHFSNPFGDKNKL